MKCLTKEQKEDRIAIIMLSAIILYATVMIGIICTMANALHIEMGMGILRSLCSSLIFVVLILAWVHSPIIPFVFDDFHDYLKDIYKA